MYIWGLRTIQMQEELTMKMRPLIVFNGFLLSGSLLVAILLTTIAMAHSDSPHSSAPTMNHMQSMQSAKKVIPEEFKVMDRTPVAPNVASIETGEKLYSENCSMCHGKKGDGKGEIAQDMELSIASFKDTHHSGMFGPGEKYWVIKHGIEALEMPSFPEFSPRERWALVNYIIYSLQKD
ncbi:MAG: hypothetical protein CL942_00055 [Desulfovibrio sp.]|nr:hypothetical protein [Desulfovibrio sp.]